MFIYPRLPAKYDLGLLRVAGAGVGNCFFTYFHAFRLSLQNDATMIAPAWHAVRIGPLLRGERTLRHYARELKPHADEVAGTGKMARLLRAPGQVRDALMPRLDAGTSVTRVEASRFTFEGLHEHRVAIRMRLLGIMRAPPARPSWGDGRYAAAHVRLGDFAAASAADLKSGTKANLRIPLSWYTHVIALLKARHPDLPIRIYSDGRAQELGELLAIDGVELHAEPGDIDDLLALAGARILIGSASTFSRWAAFLGNAPSIWFKSVVVAERPTDERIPLAYLDEDDRTLPAGFA